MCKLWYADRVTHTPSPFQSDRIETRGCVNSVSQAHYSEPAILRSSSRVRGI